MKKNIRSLKLKKNRLKINYRNEVENVNYEITKLKRINNKEFVKAHKRWFLVLDIVVIAVILMNLGALLITNVMVMKVTPDQIVTKFNPETNQTEEFIIKGNEAPILREVNPVVAEREGFIEHSDSVNLMYLFLKMTIFWTILVFVYVINRNRIDEYWKLEALTFYVLFYLIVLGTDFINDLGFLIGKMIW